MVQNWGVVTHQNAILPQKFDHVVLSFLSRADNQKILYWLDDSYTLIQGAKTGPTSIGSGNDSYYDYSFMVTPAFKALELWIIQVAPFLGVRPDVIEGAKEYGRFNTFLNDDKIQALADAVIEKLDEKSKKEKALRSSLNALSSYLTNLRHTPAHCGSVMERSAQAETHFNEIVGAVNRITALLLESGVIK